MAFRWIRRPSRTWHIGRYMEHLVDVAQVVLTWYAPEIESQMKERASWTDRTSNARQTLQAFVHRDGPYRVVLIAKQHMTYGKFLETKNGGRYAIVMPTLRAYYSSVWRDVKDAIDG